MFEVDNEALLEKLAEQFTDEELQNIVEEAGVEVEAEEVETEKTASEYYELGQIMAVGFQDQLEKEAMVGKLKGAVEAVRGAGKALVGGYQKAKAPGIAARLTGAKAKGRLGAAQAALKGLTGAQRKALGAAGAAGAVGLGAAGLGAKAMMKKKSYDEGIYDTLEYLGLLEEE